MILVENPGNWTIYRVFRHAGWGRVGENGLPVHENITPTDLVMPFFLFIVGVSIAFALWNKKCDKTLHHEALLKISIRTLKLFALGLIYNMYPVLLEALLYEGTIKIRAMGVLQRIALVYFVSAVIFLKFTPKRIIWIGVITLLAYWACTFIPVPGYPIPQLFRQYFTPGNIPSNFPEWVDANILGFADPEGIVSTLPAIITGLIGVVTGILLKTTNNPVKTTLKMLVAGFFLLIAGYIWSLKFSIIKDLWTSSYVLVSGGYSLIIFSFVYWLVDVKYHKEWTTPFVAYGVNCIFIYIISHVVASTLHIIRIKGDKGIVTLHEWINHYWLESFFSPVNASILFAFLFVILWYLPLWLMYKRKIFVKV